MVAKSRFKRHLRENYKQYLLIFLIFLAGIIFGCNRAEHLEGGVREHLLGMVEGFLRSGAEGDLYGRNIFTGALIKQAKTLLSIWLLGLTVIGFPLILVVILMRGFSLGFTIGFLLKEKANAGLLLTLITIIPQNLVYIPVFVAAAVIAINFSIYIIKSRNTQENPLGVGLLSYSLLMLILMVILAAGCFIEAFLTPWLLRMFL